MVLDDELEAQDRRDPAPAAGALAWSSTPRRSASRNRRGPARRSARAHGVDLLGTAPGPRGAATSSGRRARPSSCSRTSHASFCYVAYGSSDRGVPGRRSPARPTSCQRRPCGCSGSPSLRSRARCARPRRRGSKALSCPITSACAAARSRSTTLPRKPPAEPAYEALVGVHPASATPTRCSPEDGSTVDDQVIALLAGRPDRRRRSR